VHVVVIHGWQEETPTLVQSLAGALGLVAFEARQRLVGGGPSVVAIFADPEQAGALARRLEQYGFGAFVVDASSVRRREGSIIVRRFQLNEWSLRLEAWDGQTTEIPLEEIDLLLTGMSVVGYTETKTVTERTLSLGRTLLSGGIPMSKKVERQEEVLVEESRRMLYLYAGTGPTVIFGQDGVNYEGLGAAMKLSRELNFAYVTSELRRLCPRALYDERLLARVAQVRLLGPAQGQESSLDLAAEILARSLRA
jgi:hypothetical protein